MTSVAEAPVTDLSRAPQERQAQRDAGALWRTFLLGLFGVVVLRSAWMCDDAYITLRTVDNFVEGYGLRWNVVERVQTFTHPLWLLLLSLPYYFTREAYLTPLAVSILLSMGAVWVFVRHLARSAATGIVGALALIFSKAFAEYSTSGLENPLTYFLLALFLMLYWRPHSARRLTGLWSFAGLLMLNRLDTGLLVLPALAVEASQQSWRVTARAAAIGLAPLALWELFSIVYYGFPFPNTAYAKLQTGVSVSGLIAQGFLYLLDSVARDPVTPLAIVSFTAASVTARPRGRWPLALGIALYLVYVVRIGGDFMTGRFLAVPLFAAVALLGQCHWRSRDVGTPLVAFTIVLLGCFATTRPPILSGPDTFATEPHDVYGVGGVDDERAFYSRYTALLRTSRDLPLPHHDEVVRGRAVRGRPQVIVTAGIGMFGYYAGPAVHIVDPMALTDPLLARLPSKENWRIGHFERTVPNGYVETLQTGRNHMTESDVATAHLYEQLELITRGPIWSVRRWRAILSMNL